MSLHLNLFLRVASEREASSKSNRRFCVTFHSIHLTDLWWFKIEHPSLNKIFVVNLNIDTAVSGLLIKYIIDSY